MEPLLQKKQKAFKTKNPQNAGYQLVAERGGFEPPVRLPVRQFSKLVVSATHPPLHYC